MGIGSGIWKIPIPDPGSRVKKAPDPGSGKLLERNEPDLDENGLDPVEGAEVHRHVGEGLLLTAPASH
jgi:hypothetical protein